MDPARPIPSGLPTLLQACDGVLLPEPTPSCARRLRQGPRAHVRFLRQGLPHEGAHPGEGGSVDGSPRCYQEVHGKEQGRRLTGGALLDQRGRDVGEEGRPGDEGQALERVCGGGIDSAAHGVAFCGAQATARGLLAGSGGY